MPAARGTIFDRNGEPLAIGEQATTVFANPKEVDRPRDLTLAVAKALRIQPQIVYPLLVDKARGFVYLARKVDPKKAEQLDKLGFAGLGSYPEELRTYPQRRVASQVLGYAGLDNRGLEGLERSLENVLGGRHSGRLRDVWRRRTELLRDGRRRDARGCQRTDQLRSAGLDRESSQQFTLTDA